MDYLDKDFHNLNLRATQMQAGAMNCIPKKTGPLRPPKPSKKESTPEVPQSRNVQQACKPLYSQRLQYGTDAENDSLGDVVQKTDLSIGRQPHLQRKKQPFNTLNTYDSALCKVTLDNPAVLDQQLEVLAHHKRQLEKKGLLPNSSTACVPKLSTTSLARSGSTEIDSFYANILPTKIHEIGPSNYSNVKAQRNFFETINAHNNNASDTIYSNLNSLDTNSCIDPQEDDVQPPASPVSSSYSELRRATDVFAATKDISQGIKDIPNNEALAQSYMNVKYNAGGNEIGNFSCYSPTLQGSSTYESIYEPINPRPPSQLSSGSNYLSYSPYINTSMHSQLADRSILSNSSSLNLSSIDTSHENLSTYSSNVGESVRHMKPEAEVEALTGYLVHSMENESDIDNFGICFKCNERVLGESSGCTAMNQIYHIHCFTCAQCQINLQGKPFYALEGKPYCEYDYLQTLEKCSVCMKPILERILRATGKPYHPQCFTCVVCKKSLDGIPFTVDATNQNYCIEDFHKKFAPRCCVCKEPIMPEPGEEETVRVVALDRSFHFECYKCEDCGLLLSSEAEGRGCYPLDDHVLCKSCNAQRVQLLTNRITTEL